MCPNTETSEDKHGKASCLKEGFFRFLTFKSRLWSRRSGLQ